MVIGEGFAVWGLRALYSSDPPYNCFPSLHVAYSFLAALTCHRVHRALGMPALIGGVILGGIVDIVARYLTGGSYTHEPRPV